MVLTVKGRVGLVDAGRTFASPQTLMMSGACPPPAPSLWKVWIVRPLNALIVVLDESRFVQRVGVDRDLHVELIGDIETGADRGGRRAPNPRAASAR